MPLEWAWPQPNTTFGPGTFLHLRQTDIGPIPLDDQIEIQIRTPTEEILFGWWKRVSAGVRDWTGLWLMRAEPLVNQGWTTQIDERRNATEGEAVRLYGTQRHADGTQVGSISMPITFSPTVTSWISQSFAYPKATLDPTSTDKLDQILAAVYRKWPSA